MCVCVCVCVCVSAVCVIIITFYLYVGWDEGCLTMCQGEVARLTIAGYKGYGAQGFPAWGYPLCHLPLFVRLSGFCLLPLSTSF